MKQKIETELLNILKEIVKIDTCYPPGSSKKFSESLNNIVVFENDLYVLDVFGVVYKNSPSNIFIDVSTNVLNRIERDPINDSNGEAGLFSLAFHPSESYFLLSYSDLEDNLIKFL